MNKELETYLLDIAETRWIGEILTDSMWNKVIILGFVKDMVLDALMDSEVAKLYLKED